MTYEISAVWATVGKSDPRPRRTLAKNAALAGNQWKYVLVHRTVFEFLQPASNPRPPVPVRVRRIPPWQPPKSDITHLRRLSPIQGHRIERELAPKPQVEKKRGTNQRRLDAGFDDRCSRRPAQLLEHASTRGRQRPTRGLNTTGLEANKHLTGLLQHGQHHKS